MSGVMIKGTVILVIIAMISSTFIQLAVTDSGGEVQDVFSDGASFRQVSLSGLHIENKITEFELPNRVVIQGGQPSAITVILTAAASAAVREGGPAPAPRRRKAALLIPVIGGIFVAAFAAAEIFEKDEDASPKLPQKP